MTHDQVEVKLFFYFFAALPLHDNLKKSGMSISICVNFMSTSSDINVNDVTTSYQFLVRQKTYGQRAIYRMLWLGAKNV